MKRKQLVKDCERRDLDGVHGVHMETVDVRSLESNNKALQLLLMDGEVSSFDVQHAVTTEAQHIL